MTRDPQQGLLNIRDLLPAATGTRDEYNPAGTLSVLASLTGVLTGSRTPRLVVEVGATDTTLAYAVLTAFPTVCYAAVVTEHRRAGGMATPGCLSVLDRSRYAVVSATSVSVGTLLDDNRCRPDILIITVPAHTDVSSANRPAAAYCRTGEAGPVFIRMLNNGNVPKAWEYAGVVAAQCHRYVTRLSDGFRLDP